MNCQAIEGNGNLYPEPLSYNLRGLSPQIVKYLTPIIARENRHLIPIEEKRFHKIITFLVERDEKWTTEQILTLLKLLVALHKGCPLSPKNKEQTVRLLLWSWPDLKSVEEIENFFWECCKTLTVFLGNETEEWEISTIQATCDYLNFETEDQDEKDKALDFLFYFSLGFVTFEEKLSFESVRKRPEWNLFLVDIYLKISEKLSDFNLIKDNLIFTFEELQPFPLTNENFEYLERLLKSSNLSIFDKLELLEAVREFCQTNKGQLDKLRDTFFLFFGPKYQIKYEDLRFILIYFQSLGEGLKKHQIAILNSLVIHHLENVDSLKKRKKNHEPIEERRKKITYLKLSLRELYLAKTNFPCEKYVDVLIEEFWEQLPYLKIADYKDFWTEIQFYLNGNQKYEKGGKILRIFTECVLIFPPQNSRGEEEKLWNEILMSVSQIARVFPDPKKICISILIELSNRENQAEIQRELLEFLIESFAWILNHEKFRLLQMELLQELLLGLKISQKFSYWFHKLYPICRQEQEDLVQAFGNKAIELKTLLACAKTFLEDVQKPERAHQVYFSLLEGFLSSQRIKSEELIDYFRLIFSQNDFLKEHANSLEKVLLKPFELDHLDAPFTTRKKEMDDEALCHHYMCDLYPLQSQLLKAIDKSTDVNHLSLLYEWMKAFLKCVQNIDKKRHSPRFKELQKDLQKVALHIYDRQTREYNSLKKEYNEKEVSLVNCVASLSISRSYLRPLLEKNLKNLKKNQSKLLKSRRELEKIVNLEKIGEDQNLKSLDRQIEIYTDFMKMIREPVWEIKENKCVVYCEWLEINRFLLIRMNSAIIKDPRSQEMIEEEFFMNERKLYSDRLQSLKNIRGEV